MHIHIFQGRTAPPIVADVTIVVDVIRAFTVSHYAFLCGAEKIILAKTVAQALEIKAEHPDYLLAGEVNGLPISGFDFGNSPAAIHKQNLAGKILVQKTTNGVEATLNNLSSAHLFVTGFSNARTTATYVKEKLGSRQTVNIIASHPTGDDDLACAQYIKSLLQGSNEITASSVIRRIRHSHVAKKFFDEQNKDFAPEDIAYCTKELASKFTMKVNKSREIPMIERINDDQD